MIAYGRTIPAPTLLRHRVIDLPVVEYGLTIPAPDLVRERSFDLPLVSYAITIPTPSLARHRIIDLPVVSYGMTMPVLMIVHAGSSQRRLAYPGDSANGGTVNSQGLADPTAPRLRSGAFSLSTDDSDLSRLAEQG